MSGSMTSSKTRSGRVARTFCMASVPVVATSTAKPSNSRPADEQVGDVGLVVDDQDPVLLGHPTMIADGRPKRPRPPRRLRRRHGHPRPAPSVGPGAAGRPPAGPGPTPHQVTRPRASTTMADDILDSPDLPVDEADRHLDDRGPGLLGPIGHLDLEPVALGPHPFEVDAGEHGGRVGPEPGRRVGHPEPEHRRRVAVPALGQQVAVELPLGDRAARDIAGPDRHLVALPRSGASSSGSARGVVGEVGVHLDHDVVAALHPPGEPGAVGAARGPTWPHGGGGGGRPRPPAGPRPRRPCRRGCRRRRPGSRRRVGPGRPQRSPGRCCRSRCRSAR